MKQTHKVDPVVPPVRAWERFLNSELSTYGAMRRFEFEGAGISSNFDTALAYKCFYAIATEEMINLYIHALFPTRHPGRALTMMSYEKLAYTALGFVIGVSQSRTLAALQVRAYDRGFYRSAKWYPIYHFVLSILADYLQLTPRRLSDEPNAEPILTELFNFWREPQLEVLEPLCLAACDFHTHRCKPDRSGISEFQNGEWTRTPIEILLLFKLRELVGLSNPEIDHPLMNSALGKLPVNIDATEMHDDLIDRVRQRMMQDGFDEDEIANLVLHPIEDFRPS